MIQAGAKASNVEFMKALGKKWAMPVRSIWDRWIGTETEAHWCHYKPVSYTHLTLPTICSV
eukprot:10075038-Prorocentrum_lima.AAC.1